MRNELEISNLQFDIIHRVLDCQNTSPVSPHKICPTVEVEFIQTLAVFNSGTSMKVNASRANLHKVNIFQSDEKLTQ